MINLERFISEPKSKKEMVQGLEKTLGVVIPAYNMLERLGTNKFFKTLLYYHEQAHSHPDIRFCLVDDGSKDKSRKACEFFQSLYPDSLLEIRYLDHNTKKVGALRAGVESVDTDFILHTDFDCTLEKKSLESAINYQEEFERDPKLVLQSRKKEEKWNDEDIRRFSKLQPLYPTPARVVQNNKSLKYLKRAH